MIKALIIGYLAGIVTTWPVYLLVRIHLKRKALREKATSTKLFNTRFNFRI